MTWLESCAAAVLILCFVSFIVAIGILVTVDGVLPYFLVTVGVVALLTVILKVASKE